MRPSRIILAALALASSAAIAGTAEVRFVDPDRFTDLATDKWDEKANMDAIAHHFQQMAGRLPADHVLRVDVLDVKLAGTVRQTRRGNLRVDRNRSDAPAFRLRYTLASGGQVLKSGEERIVDLTYPHQPSARRSTTSLYDEKRLLDDWFASTFAQPVAYAR
jgi:hypothetical protein